MIDHFFLAGNPFGITAQSIGLPTTTSNLGEALTNAVQLLMGLMGGLALIFVIVGGFRLTLSRGNPGDIQKGRETVLYAVVGLIFAIAAFAVVSFLAHATQGTK